MNKPKKAKIPNNKSNIGELTLPEMEEYYNKELLVEAQELVRYHSYLVGKFEVAKKNDDLESAKEVQKELEYCNERMDFVSKRMINFRKLWKMMPNIIKSALPNMQKKEASK